MRLKNLDKLHVLTIISNPMRYQSRFDLFDIFQEDILRKGAQLWVGELASGARDHGITQSSNVHHIQWHASTLFGELFLKERMINLMIQQLTLRCPDWRYVFVTDADVRYEAGTLEETAQLLQHYHFVQPWERFAEMQPDGRGLVHDRLMPSFMYCYVNGIEWQGATSYTKGGHPGYSFAIRREAMNHIGMIPDTAICGSGDRHLMTAMIGEVEGSFHSRVTQDYKRPLYEFQRRCDRYIQKNVGYTPCLLRHGWHGHKRDRKYGERWKILIDYQFSPDKDLKIDASGMYQLRVENGRQEALRDAMRRYFKGRNEDSK